MKVTDGKRIVDIRMCVWDPERCQYSPDWSNDAFGSGNMEYIPELDAYRVEDVDDAIDFAQDWSMGRGEFYEEEDTDNNVVFIDEDNEGLITERGV